MLKDNVSIFAACNKKKNYAIEWMVIKFPRKIKNLSKSKKIS